MCGFVDALTVLQLSPTRYTTGTIPKIRCQEVDISIIDRYNSFDNRYGFFVSNGNITYCGDDIMTWTWSKSWCVLFVVSLTKLLNKQWSYHLTLFKTHVTSLYRTTLYQNIGHVLCQFCVVLFLRWPSSCWHYIIIWPATSPTQDHGLPRGTIKPLI